MIVHRNRILLIALYALGFSTATRGNLLWSFDAGAKITGKACANDDTVYVGTWNGVLHAVNRENGERRWSVTLDGHIPGAPALDGDTLYVAAYRGKVHALDARTGQERWHFDTGCRRLFSSPVVADGVLYIGDRCGRFFAIDTATGRELSHHDANNWVMGSACPAGGIVYLGRMDWSIYAYRARTLEVLWRHPTRTSVLSTPALWEQTVYCGSDDGSLYALDAGDGTERWRYQTSGWIQCRPSVHNGTVLFGSFDGHLYCLDARSGLLRWRVRSQGHVPGSAVVDGDVAGFAGTDGRFYLVDVANGSLLWQFEAPSPLMAEPAVHDGVAYVGSTGGRLYAIGIHRERSTPLLRDPSTRPVEPLDSPSPVQLTTRDGERVLFLDLGELEDVRGLEQVLHPGDKIADDPVLTGLPGAWDSARTKLYGDVHYDAATGRWQMWYSGTEDVPGGEGGTTLRNSRHIGYATSTDGVRWNRPALGRIDYFGSKANNLVVLDGQAAQVLDVSGIPGAKHRWRMYTMSFWKGQTAGTGVQSHFRVRESDEGLHWEDVRRIPYFMDVANVLIDRDTADPSMRFKAYGQNYGGAFDRTLGVATSEDGLHWSPPRTICTPADLGVIESENHFIGVTRYAGYYIALYDAMYSNHSCASELAMSRDGLHFRRLFPSRKIIPLGPPGAFDSSMITISDSFVATRDRHFQYYTASEKNYQEGPRNGLKQPWRRHIGLRVWRRDGFTSLAVPAGGVGGAFMTRPIEVRNPHQLALFLNIHTPAPSCAAVSILDGETRQPLADFEVSDPIRGVDDIQHMVTFGGKSTLAGLAGRASIRLRVSLTGETAQIYSFGFQSIAPDAPSE